MGLGEHIESSLQKWRLWRRLRMPGPIGDFYRSGGQEQLYEGLPVETDDLVIDGGGYQGDWTNEMLCRYGCRSIIFEPVPTFAAALHNRYGKNDRVEICEAALSNRAGSARIAFSMDGSSIFSVGSDASAFDVRLLDFSAFLRARAIDEIACLKLNIEGSEYNVLEQLLSMKQLTSVRCLLVQFHSIDSRSNVRRAAIQQALRETHKCVFDYPFVWECWIRAG